MAFSASKPAIVVLPIRRVYAAWLFHRLGRVLLEHLVERLVDLLGVLVGLVARRAGADAAPHKLLRVGVVHVDCEGALRVGLDARRRVQTAAEERTTIESGDVQLLLLPRSEEHTSELQ